jgi:hypothetical protein
MEIVPATPASEFQGIDNWINTYSEGIGPGIKGLNRNKIHGEHSLS